MGRRGSPRRARSSTANTAARERANVRRLPRRREPDSWTDDSASERGGGAVGRAGRRAAAAAPRGRRRRAQVRVHLVLPRSFNDAQQIADRFKDSVPVILNLQCADNELSKRLIDFASGLTYALDGSMQRVADKVFLLTPRNVEVSAEERARALDPPAVLQPGLTARSRQPRRERADRAESSRSGRHERRRASARRSASSVQRFVSVFVGVYVLLILAYVITSWIRRRVADARARAAVSRTTLRAYMRLFRRIIPRSARSTFRPSSPSFARRP